jgi:hypothetical protein
VTVHLSELRRNKHYTAALQKLWNETTEDEWELELLEIDQENDVRTREAFWMGYPKILLNTWKQPDATGHKLSDETKQKMREGRARYLKTPGARESLAERARIQHQAGKLGRQTWKT